MWQISIILIKLNSVLDQKAIISPSFFVLKTEHMGKTEERNCFGCGWFICVPVKQVSPSSENADNGDVYIHKIA